MILSIRMEVTKKFLVDVWLSKYYLSVQRKNTAKTWLHQKNIYK